MISDPQIFIRCDDVPPGKTAAEKCRRSVVLTLPSFGMSAEHVREWILALNPSWLITKERHLCPDCARARQ